MKHFCLSSRDLSVFGLPQRVYALRDVQRLCFAKYGGPAGLAAKRISNAERAAKAEETRKCRALQRRDELEEALNVVFLEFRTDNALCVRYVDAGVGNVARIVTRTAEMHFLDKYTSYAHTMHGFRCMPRGRIVDEAERRVLARIGGWPKRWPWIPTEWSTVTHFQYPKRFKARIAAFVWCMRRRGGRLEHIGPDTFIGILKNIVPFLLK